MKPSQALFTHLKSFCLFGLLLGSPLEVRAQEDLTLMLDQFSRGTLSDAFRGAQLRVDLVLRIHNSEGKEIDSAILDSTEKVIIPSDETDSDEERSLSVSADAVDAWLRKLSKKANSVSLELNFYDVDLIHNDQIKSFEVARTYIQPTRRELASEQKKLFQDLRATLKTALVFEDWVPVQIHSYQVKVDDYETQTEWTYHYGYDFIAGEFRFMYGPQTRRVKVGSHMETRSYQTGGGTKAKFRAKI